MKVDITRGILDYCDKKNLYLDYYHGVSEPGYKDEPLFCANWNKPKLKRIADVLEKKGFEIGWSDEYTNCSDCNKAIRTNADSYGWEPYFIMGDGFIVCGECVNANPDYILEYINENKAIPSHFIEVAESIGFICNENKCDEYESGFYPGQNDTPEKALDQLYNRYGGRDEFEGCFDYLFAITERGQFDVHWTVFIRVKK